MNVFCCAAAHPLRTRLPTRGVDSVLNLLISSTAKMCQIPRPLQPLAMGRTEAPFKSVLNFTCDDGYDWVAVKVTKRTIMRRAFYSNTCQSDGNFFVSSGISCKEPMRACVYMTAPGATHHLSAKVLKIYVGSWKSLNTLYLIRELVFYLHHFCYCVFLKLLFLAVCKCLALEYI